MITRSRGGPPSPRTASPLKGKTGKRHAHRGGHGETRGEGSQAWDGSLRHGPRRGWGHGPLQVAEPPPYPAVAAPGASGQPPRSSSTTAGQTLNQQVVLRMIRANSSHSATFVTGNPQARPGAPPSTAGGGCPGHPTVPRPCPTAAFFLLPEAAGGGGQLESRRPKEQQSPRLHGPAPHPPSLPGPRAPTPVTGVLLRDKERRCRKKRRPGPHGGRHWGDTSASQEHQGPPPEAGREAQNQPAAEP